MASISNKGGEEVIAELNRHGECRFWDVAENGVYFVAPHPRPMLRQLDLTSRQIRDILPLAVSPDVGGRRLSIAPDGKSALYVQYDK